MSCQEELQLFQEVHEEDDDEEEEDEDEENSSYGRAAKCLAMLQLNSTASPTNPRLCVPTPEAPVSSSILKCSKCGSTTKRRSPTSSLQEPCSKRATLPPHFNAAASTTTGSPTGLDPQKSPQDSTKILPSRMTPNLYRCLSAPVDFLETETAGTAINNQSLSPLSPENFKNNAGSPAASPTTVSLPPLPPTLRRAFSDPTVAAFPVLQSETPPPPPQIATRSLKSKPNSEKSPNTKRLQRMKERMREMSLWCDQVMQEQDEQHKPENISTTSNSQSENVRGSDEAVWVEQKAGEGLIIHFKCPCSKGYEILLSGNNCYYKLI